LKQFRPAPSVPPIQAQLEPNVIQRVSVKDAKAMFENRTKEQAKPVQQDAGIRKGAVKDVKTMFEDRAKELGKPVKQDAGIRKDRAKKQQLGKPQVELAAEPSTPKTAVTETVDRTNSYSKSGLYFDDVNSGDRTNSYSKSGLYFDDVNSGDRANANSKSGLDFDDVNSGDRANANSKSGLYFDDVNSGDPVNANLKSGLYFDDVNSGNRTNSCFKSGLYFDDVNSNDPASLYSRSNLDFDDVNSNDPASLYSRSNLDFDDVNSNDPASLYSRSNLDFDDVNSNDPASLYSRSNLDFDDVNSNVSPPNSEDGDGQYVDGTANVSPPNREDGDGQYVDGVTSNSSSADRQNADVQHEEEIPSNSSSSERKDGDVQYEEEIPSHSSSADLEDGDGQYVDGVTSNSSSPVAQPHTKTTAKERWNKLKKIAITDPSINQIKGKSKPLAQSYWLEAWDALHRPAFLLEGRNGNEGHFEKWIEESGILPWLRESQRREQEMMTAFNEQKQKRGGTANFWDWKATSAFANPSNPPDTISFWQWLEQKGVKIDGVKYLESESERSTREVKINGQLQDALGNSLDTSAMLALGAPGGGAGWGIFVLSPDGKFYVDKHIAGEYHHSSALAGIPVKGAGAMKVSAGTLIAICDKSGHYQPTADQMYTTIQQLKKNGVNPASYVVNTRDLGDSDMPGDQWLTKYLATQAVKKS
jgi:hypothetical protein